MFQLGNKLVSLVVFTDFCKDHVGKMILGLWRAKKSSLFLARMIFGLGSPLSIIFSVCACVRLPL